MLFVSPWPVDIYENYTNVLCTEYKIETNKSSRQQRIVFFFFKANNKSNYREKMAYNTLMSHSENAREKKKQRNRQRHIAEQQIKYALNEKYLDRITKWVWAIGKCRCMPGQNGKQEWWNHFCEQSENANKLNVECTQKKRKKCQDNSYSVVKARLPKSQTKRIFSYILHKRYFCIFLFIFISTIFLN